MSSNIQPQENNIQMNEQNDNVDLPEIEQTKQYKNTAQQTKKTASYTYWVDEKNKSRELPPEQRPQKIQPPKVINQKTQDGRSHWNTVGTWEHKNISLKDIQQQYSQKINQWLKENAPQIEIKSVSLNGQCELVFTRTKKALTYQINGKVELTKSEKEKQSEEKIQVQADNKEDNDSLSLSDEKSENSESSPKKKVEKKKKSQTMTFEIVDLTDHGDRDYKSKADEAQDKKWIGSKSQQILVLLENILKSYR